MLTHRPTRNDLFAVLAGAAMLAWTAIVGTPWALVGVWGVLAAAVTVWRWPATGAAGVAVLVLAVRGPSVTSAAVAGLLVAAYLVLLDGPPARSGVAPLSVGVLLAVAVVLAALGLATHPSVWWLPAGAVAAPLALWLICSGRRARVDG